MRHLRYFYFSRFQLIDGNSLLTEKRRTYEQKTERDQFGRTPADIVRELRKEGKNEVEIIIALRRTFSFTLEEAKEITVVTDGESKSLDEHLNKLANELEKLDETSGSDI